MTAAMLKMLRSMNQWELAEVCQAAGIAEGARPEEILRALSGAWWAAPWGSAEEERVLLWRAAEALNLMPRLHRQRHRLGVVERAVYGALIQQAFLTASEERQGALLETARQNLGPGHPALPAPRLPTEIAPEEQRQLTLQRLVGTGAGLRAVTQALVEVPVQPPAAERFTPASTLLAALASAGPEAWGSRVVEWVRGRRGPDLRALFAVLHHCWRHRQRLLIEMQADAAGLEDREKQLVAQLRSRLADRADQRRRLPWHRRPVSGSAVALGATAALAAESVMAGSVHLTAGLVAGSGCLWTLLALVTSPSVVNDPDRRRLIEQLRRVHRERELIGKQIAQLEE
jgi:hypothetical protein